MAEDALMTQPLAAAHPRRYDAWIYVALSTALLGTYTLANPYAKSPWTIALCWAVYAVASIPMFRYLRGGFTQPVPFMALHGFFYAIGLGFTGLMPTTASTCGKLPILRISESMLQRGLLLTLVGVVMLLCGYYATRWLLPRRLGSVAFAQFRSSSDMQRCLWLMTIAVAAMQLLRLKVGIGVLQEAATTCSTFTFALWSFLFFSKQLGRLSQAAYLLLVLPYTLVLFDGIGAGKLATTVLSLLVMAMAYMYAKRRIPWSMVAVAVLLVVVLQPIKQQFRRATWATGRTNWTHMASKVGAVEGLSMMGQLMVDAYWHNDHQESNGWEFLENSIDRINHSVVTAAIIADTPVRQPFRGGATYAPLLTKWIPRALWAGKPIENLGNRWASEYGYLHTHDIVTSFNLPWLPEFYMNFGTPGIVFGMLLLGVIFQVFNRLVWESPRGPLEYAFGLALADSVMLPESNFSLMFGSLMIGIVVLCLFIVGCQTLVHAGSRASFVPPLGIRRKYQLG